MIVSSVWSLCLGHIEFNRLKSTNKIVVFWRLLCAWLQYCEDDIKSTSSGWWAGVATRRVGDRNWIPGGTYDIKWTHWFCRCNKVFNQLFLRSLCSNSVESYEREYQCTHRALCFEEFRTLSIVATSLIFCMKVISRFDTVRDSCQLNLAIDLVWEAVHVQLVSAKRNGRHSTPRLLLKATLL